MESQLKTWECDGAQVVTVGPEEVLRRLDEVKRNLSRDTNLLQTTHGSYSRLRGSEREGMWQALLTTLDVVEGLLKSGGTKFRTELRYKYPAEYSNEKRDVYIDFAVDHVCEVLGVPRRSLNILGKSPGQVAGELSWTTGNGDVVDCARDVAVHVRDNLLNIKKLTSTATSILVVEKVCVMDDQLLAQHFRQRFPHCILVASKGCPDYTVREFLKILQSGLPAVPVFALVDSNPHGMLIYSTYKYGSERSRYGCRSTCPEMQLIGLLGSDLENVIVDAGDSHAFTAADEIALKTLTQIVATNEDERLRVETDYLRATMNKHDIQVLTKRRDDYLVEEYLPRKLPTDLQK